MGVDTHIHRVLNRLGIINTKTPLETDRVLEEILPENIKKKIHHPLVLFGRYHCMARKPKCETCQLRMECKYGKETL